MPVKTVVFYETGTLAVGKPVVVNAVLFSNYLMEEFCAVSIVTEVGAYVSNLYMKRLFCVLALKNLCLYS